MTAPWLVIALLQAAPAASPPSPETGDDDPPVRLSLATEEDEAAWRKPGFRLTLGLVGGLAHGLDEKPDGNLLGPLLRVGARLTADWSLLASFQYQATWGELGDLAGLRYLGTVEPVWHLGDDFELALGLGFAGIIEGFTGRPDPDLSQRDTLNTSYTLPAGSAPIEACQGIGVAGTLRGGWNLILGPRSAMGLGLEVDAQYTGCIDDTERVEPDTARPITRRQWWPHVAGTAAWSFTWR